MSIEDGQPGRGQPPAGPLTWVGWIHGGAALSALVFGVLHFSEERQLAAAQGDVWRLVMRAGGERVSLKELLRLSLTKLFVDQALPSAGARRVTGDRDGRDRREHDLVPRGQCRLPVQGLREFPALPMVAIQLGWMTAEVGRQPWIVYGLLRTRDAVSKVVPASHVLFSIVLFSVIYALLSLRADRRVARAGGDGGGPRTVPAVPARFGPWCLSPVSAVTASALVVVALEIDPLLVLALGARPAGHSVYSGASSPLRLRAMLLIALVGMPLVVGYTVLIYRQFRGAVRLDEASY